MLGVSKPIPQDVNQTILHIADWLIFQWIKVAGPYKLEDFVSLLLVIDFKDFPCVIFNSKYLSLRIH